MKQRSWRILCNENISENIGRKKHVMRNTEYGKIVRGE